MKIIASVLFFVFTFAALGEEQPGFDFAQSGEVSEVKKKVKKKTVLYKVAKIPLAANLDGKSFECSYRIKFAGWRHYAEIQIEAGSLKSRFNMNDDRKRRVYLPGGNFVFPEGNEFIIVMRYCSFTRSISAVVKDSSGAVLHKTKWTKTFRKCPVKNFVVNAKANQDGKFNSVIKLDREKKTIFARSQIGRSYIVAGTISDITVKIMKEGFEDRLESKKKVSP